MAAVSVPSVSLVSSRGRDPRDLRRRRVRASRVSARAASASYEPTDRVSQLQNEGAYAVLAAATKLEREGRDIVHLEIGQPGFPSPEHVVEAGVDAIRGGKTKYSSPDGTPALREAIADYVARTRGVPVTPEEVVVGPGAALERETKVALSNSFGFGGHNSSIIFRKFEE